MDISRLHWRRWRFLLCILTAVFFGYFFPAGTQANAAVLISDVPENEGVANTLANFDQLVNIQYTLETAMPAKNGYYEAGSYTGLPYSSSRIDAGFVPNYVSLYTFLTALRDPSSYLYQTNLSDLGNVNGATYYGSVCSIACMYALGIEELYSTSSWHLIPGMDLIEGQSLEDLKLGDTICTSNGGHVVMVTGIERDAEGMIKYVTISQATTPHVLKTRYSFAKIVSKFPSPTYSYYRYRGIASVPLRVQTSDISERSFDIIPKKGDKSNWLCGQTVELDVLNKEAYSRVEVERDGQKLYDLDVKDVITLENLSFGSYQARLSGPGGAGEWCRWIVVDAVSYVENNSEILFSCSNAVPVSLSWCSKSNAAVYGEPISAEERELGSKKNLTMTGKYKVRVGFKTEYGTVFSELSPLTAFKIYQEPEPETEPVTEAATETGNKAVTEPVEVKTEEKAAAKKEEKKPVIPAKGAVLTKGNYKYKVTVKAKEVAVYGPAKKIQNVRIPDKVKIGTVTYKVTSVAAGAFRSRKYITTVRLGANIKKIGEKAFANCTKLKVVKLDTNLTAIGKKAFYNCCLLTRLEIPKKVEKIGSEAFRLCKKLIRITINTTKLNSARVGSNAFKKVPASVRIKVPGSVKKKYVKLLVKRGISKKAKIS